MNKALILVWEKTNPLFWLHSNIRPYCFKIGAVACLNNLSLRMQIETQVAG